MAVDASWSKPPMLSLPDSTDILKIQPFWILEEKEQLMEVINRNPREELNLLGLNGPEGHGQACSLAIFPVLKRWRQGRIAVRPYAHGVDSVGCALGTSLKY